FHAHGPRHLPKDRQMSEPEPTPVPCNFDMAYAGRCKEPVVEDDLCEKHHGLNCAGCGVPAVKLCDHTGGFVCGAPLCAGCMHSPPAEDSPNTFGMGGGHEPKEIAMRKWEASWG